MPILCWANSTLKASNRNVAEGFPQVIPAIGEGYAECARHEIAEELGIVVDRPLQELFKLDASMRTGNEHRMVYSYRYGGPMCLQEDDIDDGQWIGAASMNRWVVEEKTQLTEVIRPIWKRFREISP